MSGDPAIGALRQRVTIESPVRAEDGGGGATVTWAEVAEVWAAIAPASANERDIAGRLDGVVSHRVVLRFRGDLAGGMRLRHDGRVFRVLVAHDPDERRRWTQCLVEEEGR